MLLFEREVTLEQLTYQIGMEIWLKNIDFNDLCFLKTKSINRNFALCKLFILSVMTENVLIRANIKTNLKNVNSLKSKHNFFFHISIKKLYFLRLKKTVGALFKEVYYMGPKQPVFFLFSHP